MAAMRRKDRSGPGMATSSESADEDAEAAGPEDRVPLLCSAGVAGTAVHAFWGAQKNAHRKIVRRNAGKQERGFMAESSIHDARIPRYQLLATPGKAEIQFLGATSIWLTRAPRTCGSSALVEIGILIRLSIFYLCSLQLWVRRIDHPSDFRQWDSNVQHRSVTHRDSPRKRESDRPQIEL
jgi:hypothetical protein